MKSKSGKSGEGSLFGTTLQIEGRTVIVQEKIGDGGFGSIYRCADQTNEHFVVKVLQAPDSEHVKQIENEIEIQKSLSSNPHVVQLLASQLSQSRQFLILMEFCEQSLVSEMNISLNHGLKPQFIAKVFASVLRAVDEMHERSISHRDLKPENVLGKAGVWKLCDFGSSTANVYDLSDHNERVRAVAHDDIERNTTPSYRAPEMVDLFRGQVIGVKADVWALGCLLYKMCTLKDAFPEATNLQILNGKYSWNCPWEVDDTFKAIVAQCLQSDPENRPTVKQLLSELGAKFDLDDASEPDKTVGIPNSTSLPKMKAGKAPKQASAKTTGQGLTAVDKYTKFLLGIKPPIKDKDSDESDIEMDEESRMTGSASSAENLSHIMDDLEFDDEDDEDTSDQVIGTGASGRRPSIINIDTTIESLINWEDESQDQEQTTAAAKASFELFDTRSTSPGGTIDELISFDDVGPAQAKPKPAAPIPRKEAAIEMLFAEEVKKPEEGPDLVSEMKTDIHAFGAKLIAMNNLSLSDTLYQLVLKCDETPSFLLTLVHESGPNATKILLCIPPLVQSPVNDYIGQRKKFSALYPMFEGNFSLSDFTKKNKASPPPPGSPPVALEVAQSLQITLDCLLSAFRSKPSQLLAEEGIGIYQVASYIIAKLKQFKIKTGFLDTTTIPVTRNHHMLLKKAFEQSGLKINFPAEPFNFDDPMIQKRLRPPSSNCTYT